MSIKTTSGGGDFQKCPTGMHVARCYKIIDCGTHVHPQFGKAQRKGLVFFELPTVLMEPNDKGEALPFTIAKRYTLSHHEKSTLRIDLESWYQKSFDTNELDKAGGFDLEKLIGRPAMLNVVHSADGKYANIKSINPMPKGMECPEQINPSFVFTIEDAKDENKLSKLSQKMQLFIAESKEVKQSKGITSVSTTPDESDEHEDEIPF